MPPPDQDLDWDRIVDEHARRVAQISLRILGSEHDAEDVAQEVFAEAVRLHRREKIRDWTGLLVRLATLRSLDRRRAHRATIGLDQIDDICDQSQHSFQESELVDWVRDQVARMPRRNAAVFTMIYFQGMSRNEVAVALEITLDNVSTTLYQARHRLKESFAICELNKG